MIATLKLVIYANVCILFSVVNPSNVIQNNDIKVQPLTHSRSLNGIFSSSIDYSLDNAVDIYNKICQKIEYNGCEKFSKTKDKYCPYYVQENPIALVYYKQSNSTMIEIMEQEAISVKSGKSKLFTRVRGTCLENIAAMIRSEHEWKSQYCHNYNTIDERKQKLCSMQERLLQQYIDNDPSRCQHSIWSYPLEFNYIMDMLKDTKNTVIIKLLQHNNLIPQHYLDAATELLKKIEFDELTHKCGKCQLEFDLNINIDCICCSYTIAQNKNYIDYLSKFVDQLEIGDTMCQPDSSFAKKPLLESVILFETSKANSLNSIYLGQVARAIIKKTSQGSLLKKDNIVHTLSRYLKDMQNRANDEQLKQVKSEIVETFGELWVHEHILEQEMFDTLSDHGSLHANIDIILQFIKKHKNRDEQKTAFERLLCDDWIYNFNDIDTIEKVLSLLESIDEANTWGLINSKICIFKYSDYTKFHTGTSMSSSSTQLCTPLHHAINNRHMQLAQRYFEVVKKDNVMLRSVKIESGCTQLEEPNHQEKILPSIAALVDENLQQWKSLADKMDIHGHVEHSTSPFELYIN